MADRLRTVRVRLTLAATVVTGVAVLIAGLWLVRRLIPADVMAECREKARTVNREGGLIRSLFRDD